MFKVLVCIWNLMRFLMLFVEVLNLVVRKCYLFLVIVWRCVGVRYVNGLVNGVMILCCFMCV